ncbi:MAG: hypothetical protein IJZ95_07150 [Oscillospiraceae bacterium]|nr:hypothetical protein [Oscillospiraceae bacterium]
MNNVRHVGKIPTQNTKSSPVTIRFSTEERNMIDEAAELRGVSRSEYIRQKSLEDGTPDIIIAEGADILHLLAKTYNEAQSINQQLNCKTVNSAEIKQQLDVVLHKQNEILREFAELTVKITAAFNVIEEVKERLLDRMDEDFDDIQYSEDTEIEEGGDEHGNS